MQIETERKLEQQYLSQRKQTLKKKKTVTRDKEGHYTTIKIHLQEDDRTNINIYAANKEALKYIKQILIDIKEETNSNAIILMEFNNLLLSIDRSTIQKFT